MCIDESRSPFNLPKSPDAGTPISRTDERTVVLLRYEPWLKLMARLQLETRFQSKFSSSDVVQHTLLEAWKGWDSFRGTTEGQRMAWLRQILAHQLARLARHHAGTQKRAIGREISLEQSLDATTRRLDRLLPASGESPSAPAQREEQQALLAELLERLPRDYREVLILRNLEDLPPEEVAHRMGRSAGAVRMLWVRALAQLRQEYLRHVHSQSLRGHA